MAKRETVYTLNHWYIYIYILYISSLSLDSEDWHKDPFQKQANQHVTVSGTGIGYTQRYPKVFRKKRDETDWTFQSLWLTFQFQNFHPRQRHVSMWSCHEKQRSSTQVWCNAKWVKERILVLAMNNLYRYYSSDIYGMNNLMSEDMLHWLPWAAQKWLVCSNEPNALAEWFCQTIHERSPNNSGHEKDQWDLCWDEQWRNMKKSYYEIITQPQFPRCNMLQSSQYLVWPGLFGSRKNTWISPPKKTKQHESCNTLECLQKVLLP